MTCEDQLSRPQVVRLLQQALHDLDFHELAQELAVQSGIEQNPVLVLRLEELIRQHEYLAALDLLKSLSNGEEDSQDEIPLIQARSVISEHYFKRLLAQGKKEEALRVLQDDLSPFPANQSLLPSLAHQLINSTAPADSRKDSDCDLVQRVRKILARRRDLNVLAGGRWKELLHQAVQWQELQCPMHWSRSAEYDQADLFVDHYCPQDRTLRFQRISISSSLPKPARIAAHFSPDGNIVASTCQDEYLAFARLDSSEDKVTSHKADDLNAWCRDGLHFAWASRPSSQTIPSNGVEVSWAQLSSETGRIERLKVGMRATRRPGSNLLSLVFLDAPDKLLLGYDDQVLVLFDVEREEAVHTWARLRAHQLAVSDHHKADLFFLALTDDNLVQEIQLTGPSTASAPYPVTRKIHVPAAFGDATALALSDDNKGLLVACEAADGSFLLSYSPDFRSYPHPTRLLSFPKDSDIASRPDQNSEHADEGDGGEEEEGDDEDDDDEQIAIGFVDSCIYAHRKHCVFLWNRHSCRPILRQEFADSRAFYFFAASTGIHLKVFNNDGIIDCYRLQ